MRFLFLQIIQYITDNRQLEMEDENGIELMSYFPLEDLIP